ncbi:hypothetical protein MTO96_000092 [Rhipicephalus appendiculatus]
MILCAIAIEEDGDDFHEQDNDQSSEEYAVGERDADTPLVRVRRGFGCPRQKKCNKHCQSIQRRAGYCDGPFKLRCVCTT